MAYNEKLDEKRLEAGLTLEEFARIAKIDVTTCINAVNGKRKTTRRTWYRLAKALGCSVEEIGGVK